MSVSRTCLITGGSHGIGLEVCRQLASAGSQVLLHAPTPIEAHAAVERLVAEGVPARRLHPVAADFRRLSDVMALARHLGRRHPRLDLLVNNAGIVAPAERICTVDDHETTFQVDYLAHYVLTRMLSRPLNTASARVVTVSSAMHRLGYLDFDDPDFAYHYRPFDVYARAKLAQILFTQALARTAEHRITAVAVHPGYIDTGTMGAVYGNGGLPVVDGAAAILHAADAGVVVNGGYYEGTMAAQSKPSNDDPAPALSAWRATARLLGWEYSAERTMPPVCAG